MSRRRSPPTTLDPAEIELFRSTVGPVRPVKSTPALNLPAQSSTRAPLPRPTEVSSGVMRHPLSDVADTGGVTANDVLRYTRSGVSQRQLMKLRRGEFPIQSELDLHGYTVNAARSALAEFLQQCQQRNIRSIRIIHGKGHGSSDAQPILKNNVNHWLQQWDGVIAFCSARPVDGGTGAVYVLLRAL